MSEQKLISPLLDGFDMGNPISEHNGIRCCPAIKENTDKKYIVKIIAIPATQAQMDALLLAGAYKDPSGAMDYFREKSEDVLKEAELLKTLSKLDGFLAYENWQMEPITRHRLGYEVYLVGSYKRSLDRYIRHNAVTHLEAINLGLDMCNALSVCRQAGSLYVDLKPSNIFMSEKKEYRIGDLGFISMDALRYTALPEKYLSSYTPPELFDPMATVNLTADTYALGMILYQLYNDGTLPFRGKAPEEGLPSPAQADYELAEIIMKAIHPDPEQRWTDPAEMGKALAAYMQRNSVNDVAITPLRTKKRKFKKEPEESSAPEAESTDPEQTMDVPEEPVPEDTISGEPAEVTESEADAEEIPFEEPEELGADESLPEETEPDVSGEVPAEAPEESDVLTEEAEEEPEAEPEPMTEDVQDPEESETDPEAPAEPEEISEEEPEEELVLSEELSRIIAQADDLIAHETPEGVHMPVLQEAPDPFSFAMDEEEIDDSGVPMEPLMEEPSEEQPEPKSRKRKEKKYADPKYKRRRKRLVSGVIAVVLLALAGSGAFWYYQNQYLQPIEALTITGTQNQLTVQVVTPIDEDLLTVTCQDPYGKVMTSDLEGGQAVFTGLESNTMYTIRLDIEGFHGLVGKTSDIFTTDATTTILSFASVAGVEDGSVMLNFTVDGHEPSHWTLYYGTEGEEEQKKTFQGHSVTVNDLSIGKRYTFRLDAGGQLTLNGTTTLELMGSRLILAENISVTSASGSDMTIRWKAPGDVVVDNWEVRCYNGQTYNETLTVTEPTATFTGIDPATEYTIEITASGMTQPVRTGITANPISIQTLDVDESEPTQMTVTWTHTGEAPEGGWLLTYTVDGSESHVVKSTKPSAVVAPRIPGGKYTFTVHAADGTSVFNDSHAYTAGEAQSYNANKLTTDMLSVDLLKTPAEENWTCDSIADDQYTDQFMSGEPISVALRSNEAFYLPGAQTDVLFVVRDSYGNALADHSHLVEMNWKNIWSGGDSKNGELDLPSTPTAPGEYTFELYFDGMLAAELPFTIF